MNEKRRAEAEANYRAKMDHIIPMSKGGGHTWNNIQIAHIICNSRKETSLLV